MQSVSALFAEQNDWPIRRAVMPQSVERSRLYARGNISARVGDGYTPAGVGLTKNSVNILIVYRGST